MEKKRFEFSGTHCTQRFDRHNWEKLAEVGIGVSWPVLSPISSGTVGRCCPEGISQLGVTGCMIFWLCLFCCWVFGFFLQLFGQRSETLEAVSSLSRGWNVRISCHTWAQVSPASDTGLGLIPEDLYCIERISLCAVVVSIELSVDDSAEYQN